MMQRAYRASPEYHLKQIKSDISDIKRALDDNSYFQKPVNLGPMTNLEITIRLTGRMDRWDIRVWFGVTAQAVYFNLHTVGAYAD